METPKESVKEISETTGESLRTEMSGETTEELEAHTADDMENTVDETGVDTVAIVEVMEMCGMVRMWQGTTDTCRCR